MDDGKLPDLSRVRNDLSKRRVRDNLPTLTQLPAQESAEDTSNWDDRTFSVPSIEVERELLFEIPPIEEAPNNPYLEQERVKSAIRAKKNSKH
jgi:hypothetical protein